MAELLRVPVEEAVLVKLRVPVRLGVPEMLRVNVEVRLPVTLRVAVRLGVDEVLRVGVAVTVPRATFPSRHKVPGQLTMGRNARSLHHIEDLHMRLNVPKHNPQDLSG